MSVTPEKREALLHPTMDRAMKLWRFELLGPPIGDAPLAGLHKARLLWPESSAEMIAVSKKWLTDHGYEARVIPTGVLS